MREKGGKRKKEIPGKTGAFIDIMKPSQVKEHRGFVFITDHK
jgi:hypothetical protein